MALGGALTSFISPKSFIYISGKRAEIYAAAYVFVNLFWRVYHNDADIRESFAFLELANDFAKP